MVVDDDHLEAGGAEAGEVLLDDGPGGDGLAVRGLPAGAGQCVLDVDGEDPEDDEHQEPRDEHPAEVGGGPTGRVGRTGSGRSMALRVPSDSSATLGTSRPAPRVVVMREVLFQTGIGARGSAAGYLGGYCIETVPQYPWGINPNLADSETERQQRERCDEHTGSARVGRALRVPRAGVRGAGPNRFLVDEVTDLRPGTALDVACGEGRNAVWLTGVGWRVVGVDFSPVGLEKSRQLATQRGVTVDWVQADLTTWEPPSTYDLVAVMYLHLPGDLPHKVVAGWRDQWRRAEPCSWWRMIS